ncbi:hypothetical protein ACMA5I_15515 [Paracoccaceae bacterium GXU_MW_L88]
MTIHAIGRFLRAVAAMNQTATKYGGPALRTCPDIFYYGFMNGKGRDMPGLHQT